MSKKPLWRRKKTANSWVRIPLRKSRVKPNEKVRATVDELGQFFNEFELLEKGTGSYENADYEKQTIEEPDSKIENTFHVEPAETAGWYNIVDSTGKIMNEKKLRATEAEELRKQLEE